MQAEGNELTRRVSGMDQLGGRGTWQADGRWRRLVRVAGIAVGLLLVERLLVGEVGSPTGLVRTLLGLADPWADPIISMLALMTLIAEVVVGYLLLLLALRSLGTLPGLTGRLARRSTFAVTPALIQRLVDLLVGGALLVQVSVAVPGPSPGPRSTGSREVVTVSSGCGRAGGPATAGDLAPLPLGVAQVHWLADRKDPVETRPTPRRSAAPLPPWLGGGPSKPAPGHRADTGDHTGRAGDHTVEAGDTLWDIAAAHLVPAERSNATIHRYWHQVYRANRAIVGPDPDLIRPGTRLDVVPFRRERR
jgi:resuscitation-promoting factor RpfA